MQDVKSRENQLPTGLSSPQLTIHVGQIFPSGVMVAYKRERNLKELLTRADPYAIKPDITDLTPRGYKRCNSKCDSCDA